MRVTKTLPDESAPALKRASETAVAAAQSGLVAARKFANDLKFGSNPLRDRLLIAAGMIVGIIAISYLLGIPQWMKQRRETRQWVVTNKLTPDSLIARCGTPLTDETRDLYPMVARDITYRAKPAGTVLLKFSRTSEEGSDWVFMSMQDAATGATYDTPVAKISALACLDSSK